MHTREQNLVVARQAIAFTQRRLTIGRGNSTIDVAVSWLRNLGSYDSSTCVEDMRSDLHAMGAENQISSISYAAEQRRCGNCREFAAVVFMYLVRRNYGPLDYMSLRNPNGDHAFVVIDRLSGSADSVTTDWGSAAVICDAYYGRAYPCWQFGLNHGGMIPGSDRRWEPTAGQ